MNLKRRTQFWLDALWWAIAFGLFIVFLMGVIPAGTTRP